LWTIIDNILYLYDIKYVCAKDSAEYNNMNLNNIEEFLKTKFSKDILPISVKKNEHFKNGVIPEVWFSDTLYIKRHPKKGEFYLNSEYKNEPFTRLIFKEGRLIGKKTVLGM
jgi:hypothetical protein